MAAELRKEMPITQAEQGESLGLRTIDSYDKFKTELSINGVKDIFDQSKVQIKQDDLKYIFVIKNTPTFAVDKIYMQNWIENFYTEQTQEELAIRLLDTQIQYIRGTYQGELNALKSDIAMESSIENINYKIDRYIEFFKQERELTKENTGLFRGQKYDRKDKGLRDIQKIEIDRRIEELQKIKKQVERLENNQGKKYTITKNNEVKEVKMDDINAYDQEITILQLNQRIEELGKEAPEFIKTRNEIVMENGDTTPYYEIIMNNVQDNASLKLAFKKINDDLALSNKMALSADKRRALERDLENLQNYLEKYMNNPETFDPAKEPFVAQSGAIFEEFYKQNPVLKNLIQLNTRAGKKTGEQPDPAYPGTAAYTTEQEGKGNATQNNLENQKETTTYTSSNFSNTKEAFEKGGIDGMIKYGLDQTHMTPEQKQFRSGAANLAVTGGVVFLGWKMISSAFQMIFKSKKGVDGKGGTGIYDSKNRARLGIPTALIFGSQARSGEGPMSLYKGGELTQKISGIFGGSNKNGTEMSKEQSSQEEETRITYAEGFPGATALFNGLTYGEMGQFLIQDDEKIKIDPEKYDTLIDMFQYGDKKNEAAVEFLKSIGKNDNKNIIDLALTGMGISSIKQLQDTPDKAFNETASEAIVRLATVDGYMTTKGYNKINPETQHLVEQYIAGTSDDDLEDLDARGDVFYKEVEVTDKTGLQNRIIELAGGDSKKANELLLAINTFRESMPNGERNIELRGTRDAIEFVTYNKSSTINLEKKTLTGFTPDRFDSYAELFKAASLTNYLKYIFQDKTAVSAEPFHIDTATGNIEFDNADWYEFRKKETTAISAGRFTGKLETISPVLETNKEAYCRYLNSLHFWKTA